MIEPTFISSPEPRQKMAITVAFVAIPRTNQEWQSLLQAASWRHHFGDSVNIQVFIPKGQSNLLPPRIVHGFSSMNCRIREAALSPLDTSNYLNHLTLPEQEFDTETVFITRTSTLVNMNFLKEFQSLDILSCAYIAAKSNPEEVGTSIAPLLERLAQYIPLLRDTQDDISYSLADPSFLFYKSESEWHITYRKLLQITSKLPPTDISIIFQILPSLASALSDLLPKFLNEEQFGVRPRIAGINDVKLYTYFETSEIYKSGLNRTASKMLFDSQSGFKDLMDLLQNKDTPPPPVFSTTRKKPVILEARNDQASSDPPERFVIIGAMRTGSNLLQDYINQCPDARCFGELFNPAFINEPQHKTYLGLTLHQRNANPTDLINRVFTHHPTTPVVGFRYFDNHIWQGLQAWLQAPKAKVVFLSRDPLESYISLQNALATKQWLLKNNADRKMAIWAFNGPDFLQYCKRQSEFYTRARREVRCVGLPTFHISYRELHDQDLLVGLSKFIGSTPPSRGFIPNIIKQIDLHPREFVSNFDDIGKFKEMAQINFPTLDWSSA